jgi:hypothetical protein
MLATQIQSSVGTPYIHFDVYPSTCFDVNIALYKIPCLFVLNLMAHCSWRMFISKMLICIEHCGHVVALFACQEKNPCLVTEGNSNSNNQQNESSARESFPEHELPEDGSLPAVVVYLIDPFSYSQEWSPLHRLAMVGLLRAYQQMVLPPHLLNNTYLQVNTVFFNL